jgi:hypothetical protein
LTQEPCTPNSKLHKGVAAASLLAILFLAMLFPLVEVNNLPAVMASPDPTPGTLAPSHYWGPFFGTSGDVQINVTVPGIAVRVEIPRQFLVGVISKENDTHFIQSDIRNDYYYYSVVDESAHWSYEWNGTDSDAPCYKPEFSIYDPNAPWCVEIWNYLNGSFKTFTAPKFVRFIGLNAPTIAGMYNFTLFVATATNTLGLPDFVHASSKAFYVPVSMNDDPASITGQICDADVTTPGCVPILAKGVVYATNQNTGQEAMAYVNQTDPSRPGFFNLTGLAPGTYWVTGSAGVFNGVAYSLSDTSCTHDTRGCYDLVNLDRGDHTIVELWLHRAPQVCGLIDYYLSGGVTPLAHSLSDHPYLENVGIRRLNITVEARDQTGHVYRYMANSTDSSSDSFDIITGNNTKYVGLPWGDPYGTEFAGLPRTASEWPMTVQVFITGYLQKVIPVTVPLTTAEGCVGSTLIDMEAGGVISGTIQLLASPPTGGIHLQSPNETEYAVGITPASFPYDSGKVFGGNILIRAYDHTGVMRGIVVVNGTYPNGTTIYRRLSVLRFYVIGFSEYYNRTWSGTWGEEDYGLPEDTGYQLKVLIRGYEQYNNPTITLSRGGNQSITIQMVRGGVIEAAAYSYDTRPGTRAIQAGLAFTFLNLSIPVRARIYFYDSSGRTVGFVERLIRLIVANGLNATNPHAANFFRVVFAGQNWSLREIWFYGFQPTHLTSDTYSIDGYTLGYVQQGPVSVPMTLAGFAQALVALLLGNEISLTSPVFAEPSLLWHIPEHDHSLAETFSSSLAGAVPANLTAGIPTLNFTIFGFGGMVQNTTLNGQGHFFYVSPDGNHDPPSCGSLPGNPNPSSWCDYGLDVGSYTTQIPEFGFNRHFTPLGSMLTIFNDLFLEQGIFLNVFSMARISSSTALIMGWVVNPPPPVIPLSWVTVQATNGTTTVSVPTLDGAYVGPGALNLPAGTYNITFSVPFYEPPGTPQNPVVTNFPVYWNDDVVVLPPKQYLCPLADPSICGPDPPAPPSPTHPTLSTLQAFANYMLSNPMQVLVNVWLIGAFYIIYERKDL